MDELKQRKCKACKTPFTPARSTQTACGIDCAMQLAHEKKVKLAECDRLDTVRKDRVRKERLKTRRDWEKEAQTAFNAFIRARDKDMPCICCGLPLSAGDVGGAYDCGHYRSVGSAPHLRFHEDNAHAQRKWIDQYTLDTSYLTRQAISAPKQNRGQFLGILQPMTVRLPRHAAAQDPREEF